MEEYLQISIEIETPATVKVGSVIRIKNAVVHYSDIGIWPERGLGWYGMTRGAELNLVFVAPDLVSLKGIFPIEVIHAREGSKTIRTLDLDEKFRLVPFGSIKSCAGENPKCPE